MIVPRCPYHSRQSKEFLIKSHVLSATPQKGGPFIRDDSKSRGNGYHVEISTALGQETFFPCRELTSMCRLVRNSLVLMISDIRVAMDSWPGVPCTKVAPLLGEEKK